MMSETYEIQDLPDGLLIRIPISTEWMQVAGDVFFIAIWAFLETTLIRQTGGISNIDEMHPFSLLFLILWTGAGLSALVGATWRLMGEEKVWIRRDAVSVKRHMVGIGIRTDYPLNPGSDIRVVAPRKTAPSHRKLLPFQFRNDGWIVFDSPEGLNKFGSSLDRNSANDLLDKLRIRGFG